jgi:DoxX-like family
VVTPIYVLTGTLLASQLWADPLGPLTKIGPMLLATLFTLAILDER